MMAFSVTFLQSSQLSTKRQDVIRRFAGKGVIYKNGDTKELIYNEQEFANAFQEGYLNKCAFAYIVFGYFISIFGSQGSGNKLRLACLIVLSTIMLLYLTKFIIGRIIKNSKKINMHITSEELEKLGIEPDIESASTEEILNMFK